MLCLLMNNACTSSKLSFFHSIPEAIKRVVCRNLGADTARTVELSKGNSQKYIPYHRASVPPQNVCSQEMLKN